MRTFRVARKLASIVRGTLGATGVNLFVRMARSPFRTSDFHVQRHTRYPNDGFGAQLSTIPTPIRPDERRWTIAEAIRFGG